MKSRLFGVLLLTLGLVCGYFGLWQPLRQAQAGAESITLYGGLKLTWLIPVCVLFGLGCLLGGGRFATAMHNHDPDNRAPPGQNFRHRLAVVCALFRCGHRLAAMAQTCAFLPGLLVMNRITGQ
jgi:hypothetical protein